MSTAPASTAERVFSVRATMVAALRVERAWFAVVQDLGRPGLGGLGIATNGAADHGAARVANLLVGNLEESALVEVTGSELACVAMTDLLVAVTGGSEAVLVDGHRQPAWEALTVSSGSRIVVPVGTAGLRSYLAVNGDLAAPRAFGSVAPDPLVGVGTQLSPGDHLVMRPRYTVHAPGPYGRLFRLAAQPPARRRVPEVRCTPGPDLDRLAGGPTVLEAEFCVSPTSNHVGLRLEGPPVLLTAAAEILSRGVPVGAVQVPPSGGVIVLLRGRMVTAGYAVGAVVTTESLDVLGQLRPGDRFRFRFCELTEARQRLAGQAAQRTTLAGRVRNAFISRGLGSALHPQLHSDTPSPHEEERT